MSSAIRVTVELCLIGLVLASSVGVAAEEERNAPSREQYELIKVIYERPLTREERDRYEVGYSIDYDDHNPTEDDLRSRIDSAKRKSDVVRVELLLDRESKRQCFKIVYLGEDRIQRAKNTEWKEYALKNLSVGKDQGNFRLLSKDAFWRGGAFIYFEETGTGYYEEEFSDIKKRYGALATIAEVQEKVISPHDVLRNVIRGKCTIKDLKPGKVVVSTEKSSDKPIYHIIWASGEHTVIHLAGGDGNIEKLVPLYAEKFPSSLPKGLKVDREAWAREEMDRVLAAMKKVVETKKDHEARAWLNKCLLVEQYVFLPYQGPAASLDDLKKKYEYLADWWPKVKNQTSWRDDIGRLVAKGYSPEDVVAERNRQIDAILAKPISPEKLEELKTRVTKQFDDDCRARVASSVALFGKDSGSTFEKTADGGWEIRTKLRENEEPVRWSYKQPDIIERPGTDRPSKRYPYQAIFRGKYFGQRSKDGVDTTDLYFYDKLTDSWVTRMLH